MRRGRMKLKYRSFVMEQQVRKLYRNLTVVFLIGILVVLVVFLVVIPLARQMEKPAYLDVWLGEKGTVGERGGQEYRNGVYELEPGGYKAVVVKEGVERKSFDLNLVQNQTTGLYLDLVDGKWRLYTAEELTGRKMIVAVLPLKFTMCEGEATRMNCDAVEVGYDTDAEGELRLTITGRKSELTEETLEQVREKLAEKGYDLDNYTYIYRVDL